MRHVPKGLLAAVATSLATAACEESGIPRAPPEERPCVLGTAREDERPPFYLAWCSDDWSVPGCFRLVADPGECPDGQALLGCFYTLDEITGRWTFECGIPAECEPNHIDNPPCCPTGLTEATTCAASE